MLCERCKREIYRYELCNYCGRKVCDACVKSTQRSPKTRRLVICGDCWGRMDRRMAFKRRKSGVVAEEEA